MRRLLIIGVMLICFSVTTKAQQYQFHTVTDSLKSGSDTVKVFDFNSQKGLKNFSIVGSDTGSVITDSVKLYIGSRVRNSSGLTVDTLWTQAGLKDSTGTIVFTIAKAGGNSRFYLDIRVVELIKVVLTNTNYVAGRLWKFVITTINY